VLARKRQLDVTQSGRGGSIGNSTFQARPRVAVIREDRVAPALGFLLETLEVAAGELVAHGTFLHNVPDVR